MIEKKRPTTSIKYDFGCDGRDGCYYIEYSCPTCGRTIFGYKSSTACDRCGTFYDWGQREPKIEIIRSVKR